MFRIPFVCFLAGGLFTPLVEADPKPEMNGGEEASDPKTFKMVPQAVGKPLPAFSVVSGDGQKLTHKDIPGRVTAVFYETRETVETNRPLKKAVRRAAEARSATSEDWVAVAIVDASSANAFSRPFWRDALRKRSLLEGLTIYGDWDGKAGLSLGVGWGMSNLILTDRAGVIRYFGYGRFDERETQRITGVFSRLLREEPTPTPGEGSHGGSLPHAP